MRYLSNNNYCSNCGEKLDNTANFCSNCGQKIGKENSENTNTDWTYEEVYNNSSGFSKFWGHILIGIFFFFFMDLGVMFFGEIV